MAQEENDRKVLQQEGLQIDPTKYTTEQVVPSQLNLDRVNELYKKAEGIDLSEESISRAPSILAMTQLGKRTTDNYLEQQKRNQRAGKFAAWSQFANALAAFAGGAINGQAMPLQQNYNLPMTSFQKADAYRDAMAQNEEKYESAKISAMQNEKARRMQEKNMYMEAAQKELDNAYKYGNKVKTETSPLDTAGKLADIKLKESRAGYYNKRAAGGGNVTKIQELNYIDQFSNSADVPSWMKHKRTYAGMYPEFQRRISAIKEEAEKKPVAERNELERYLTGSDGSGKTFDQNLILLQIDPSQITQKEKNWYHNIIMMDPERFRDIIEDDSYGFKRTSMSGVYGSDNDNDSDEETISKNFLGQ